MWRQKYTFMLPGVFYLPKCESSARPFGDYSVQGCVVSIGAGSARGLHQAEGPCKLIGSAPFGGAARSAAFGWPLGLDLESFLPPQEQHQSAKVRVTVYLPSM